MQTFLVIFQHMLLCGKLTLTLLTTPNTDKNTADTIYSKIL
jgi:hypothetical protein